MVFYWGNQLAGTLFGLPLSVQIDANGDPLAGCKLYIYAAGTSTPATTYEDFGLTTGLELSFPIVADSAGRIPQFWVADGSYRARLVDAAGNEIFDLSSVTAIGASTGTVSTGTGVSDTALIQTGDFIWNPVSGTRTGFVRANGRTIGSSSSGATERASSDAEDLFLHLWNNYSDTLAPVTGGRGGTAAADWAANKKIATPDMRGRAPFGLDDMANSAAGRISGGTSVVGGGSATTTLVTGNLPAHTHDTGTYAVSAHTHDTGTYAVSAHTHGTGTYAVSSHSHDQGTLAGGSHSHGAGTFAVGTGITVTNGTNQAVVSGGTGTSGWTSGGSGGSVTITAALNSGAVSGTSGANTVAVAGNTGSTTPTLSGSSASATPTLSGVSGSATPTLSGASGSTGSGTAATTISPYMLGTWYIKL